MKAGVLIFLAHDADFVQTLRHYEGDVRAFFIRVAVFETVQAVMAKLGEYARLARVFQSVRPTDTDPQTLEQAARGLHEDIRPTVQALDGAEDGCLIVIVERPLLAHLYASLGGVPHGRVDDTMLGAPFVLPFTVEGDQFYPLLG